MYSFFEEELIERLEKVLKNSPDSIFANSTQEVIHGAVNFILQNNNAMETIIATTIQSFINSEHRSVTLEHFNPYTQIEVEYIDLIFSHLKNKKNLDYLKISHYNDIRIPDSIGNLNTLKGLVISNNKNIVIPETLGNLSNLRTLDFTASTISGDIPYSLSGLKSLNHLCLHGCGLKQVPEFIADLEGIKTLDLSNNQLSKLPDFLFKIKSLEKIAVEENNFEKGYLIDVLYVDVENKGSSSGWKKLKNPNLKLVKSNIDLLF